MNRYSNNKKHVASYEELLQSKPIKYPTYNKTLYNLFSPHMTFTMILVIVTSVAKLMYGEWGFAFITATISAFYIVLEVTTIGDMVGHGVGVIRREKVTIVGIPGTIFAVYSVLSLLMLLVVIISLFFEEKVVLTKATFLSIAMMFGLIMSMLTWRLHTYYKVWYGNEDDARLEFKDRYDNDEVIKVKVNKLKELGILR